MLNTNILSVREVADALHLSIQYVRNLISTGELDSVKIEGRRYVTQANVDAYYGPERYARNAERARLRRLARQTADLAYDIEKETSSV